MIATAAVALSILAPALVRAARERPRPTAVLREALEAGLTIHNQGLKDNFLRDIGWDLARGGLIEEARRASEAVEAVQWRTNVVCAIAVAQAESGDSKAAWRTIESIGGGATNPDHFAATRLVSLAQARRGDLAGATATLRLMGEPGLRAWTVAEVAEVVAQAGDVPGAIALAKSLDDPKAPDAADRALARIAGVQAKAGDLAGAYRTAEAVKGEPGLGLVAIAEARLKADDLKGAADAARRALDRKGGWQTEADARSALVRALAAEGDLDAALRGAADPWQVPKLTWRNRHMPPSIDGQRGAAIQAIAFAQARRGDLDAALTTLARLKRPLDQLLALVILARFRDEEGHRAEAVGRILPAAVKVAEEGKAGFYLKDLGEVQMRFGQVNAARDSFKKALFAHDLGTPMNRRSVVVAQAQSGDLEGTLGAIASIPEAEVRDQARAWVANDLARRGDRRRAVDLAATIADPSLRATARARLGKALSDAGDRVGSADLFRLACESADAFPAEAAYVIAYFRATTVGEAPAALAWARRLPSPEARARALLGVSRALVGREIWVTPNSPYDVPPHAPPRRPGNLERSP